QPIDEGLPAGRLRPSPTFSAGRPDELVPDGPGDTMTTVFRSRGDPGGGMLGGVADVTHLLTAIERGDPDAAGQLWSLVYDELRRLAGAQMARERAGHTLDATALVHEAYLRLAGDAEAGFANRRHFYA